MGMWAWFAIGLTGLMIAVDIWLWRYYVGWLRTQNERVANEGDSVQTPLGKIQYDMYGSGPVILHFHGGNVGHNGAFMLDYLVEAGFTVLTPDRPGYLGTPLSGNGNPAQQADLFAQLLDHLKITSVTIVGVSAGGPGAIQFALRYPERTRGLVLMSAITQKTDLSDDQLNSTLGKLVMSRRGQNIAYFLIHRAMVAMPKLALQDFVRTETTYGMNEGKRLIKQITSDPDQRKQVRMLADAMVPALPRFEGVMNDLEVQQSLPTLPLDQIDTPTLIIHSDRDGDVPYSNATHAHSQIRDSELMTVAQFGHMIWWGDPQVTRDFQGKITDFVRRITDE
jgi:pimeloyl-ACP methyl ester carboxylesterase